MSKRDIAAITIQYFQVPLERMLVDALHGEHNNFELIIVTIKLEDGSSGVGYTYTGGKGGKAIYTMLQTDLAPILIGQDSHGIEKLWHDMQNHIHYVGRGGIDAFAIAAIDIALWDLQAQHSRMPLWRLLGGVHSKINAYAGAIDLNFTIDELIENNLDYLRKGFKAVKIKLGKPTIEEDIERVVAVRKAIGKDTLLMVDANTSWSVERAIITEKRLRAYDIFWIEEPIIPDDINGYSKVSLKTQIPIAAGENFHSIYEFKNMIEYGKIDFPQPDASNVGGITGWNKVAQFAYAHNLSVSTHGMQELHVSLLSSIAHPGYLEVHSFPIDSYTTRPLVLQDGFALPPETDGHGVSFLWEKLAPYEIKIRLEDV